MEDRITEGLYLEMADEPPEEYDAGRLSELCDRDGVERVTLWRNERPHREEYPRTVPEFETLVICEVGESFAAPRPAERCRGHHFRHYRRPGQGTLSGKPTLGLSLVLVSPRTPAGAQAFRDWADFLHIREIAAASVPGFTMITAYENVSGGSPRFLHFYEMDTPDAEEAFQRMAPATIERLRPRGRGAVREWAGHAELVIDYVNSFTRVREVEAGRR